MGLRIIAGFSASAEWQAVFATKADDGTTTTTTDRLIGWAVTHNWERPEGRQSGGAPTVRIEGVTAPTSLADDGLIEDADSFLGYCHIGEKAQSEAWLAKARQHFGEDVPADEVTAKPELAPETPPTPTKSEPTPRLAPKGKQA